MPRPRERVCLQDGLKLDLNRLARNGFIRRGSRSGPLGIRWYSSYWDEELASCLITADMSGPRDGSNSKATSTRGLFSSPTPDVSAADNGISCAPS